MEEIQQEARRRFPIGCTFWNTMGKKHVLINDRTVYCIVGSHIIYASDGYGCLWRDGKWATTCDPEIKQYIIY